MLKHKSSTSTSARKAMPPPPAPTSTSDVEMMNEYADFSELIHQAYVSPDMGSGDSAVFGSNGGADPSGVSLSGAGPGTTQTAAVSDMDLNQYLSWMSPATSTSPYAQPLPTPVSSQGPPSTSFASPALFPSPLTEALNTPQVDASFFGRSPQIVSASPAQPFNLFDDLEGLTSLFPTFKTSMTTSPNPTTSPTTIKPTELGLQLSSLGSHSSWEQSPSPLPDSVIGSVSPKSLSGGPAEVSVATTSRASSAAQLLPNGVRKNVKVVDLIPLDAPIQSRNYITPSATSRKDIPPSVARTFNPNSRKRSSQSAGLPSAEEMRDELEEEEDSPTAEERQRRREMDPEKAALLEHVEAARRRNTLAARKSRQRKLEHVRNLEELIERLQKENEELKMSKEEVVAENATLKKRIEELEARRA